MAADLARLEAELEHGFAADPEQAGPYMQDLFRAGGKRLRPALVFLAARLGGAGYDAAAPAAAAIELIHASTLVHDDVIDRSPTRRGRPTIASAAGEGRAIVIGDYYFARAYAAAARLPDPAVVRLLAEAVAEVCTGELHQQQGRHRYRPGLYRYFRIARLKTACLLEAACRAGGITGGLSLEQQDALGRYALNLGLAFQIADDLLDYEGEEIEIGKPVGHDLLEGSATLPLILARRDPDVAEELDLLLIDKTPLTPEAVARVVDLVRRSQGPAWSRERADRLAGRARDALRGLPEGDALDALTELPSYVVGRTA